jgi:hypothetical protein
MEIACSACCRVLAANCFTGNQLGKGNARRCRTCVAGSRISSAVPIKQPASQVVPRARAQAARRVHTCSACLRGLQPDSFTTNQLRKVNARCRECVSAANWAGALPAARTNGFLHGGSFDFPSRWYANPFAEGHFRFAALGTYVGGPRNHQQCVGKWFKEVCISHCFVCCWQPVRHSCRDHCLCVSDRYISPGQQSGARGRVLRKRHQDNPAGNENY